MEKTNPKLELAPHTGEPMQLTTTKVDAAHNECEAEIAANVREHLSSDAQTHMLLLDVTVDDGSSIAVAVIPRDTAIANSVISEFAAVAPIDQETFVNLASYTTNLHAPFIAVLTETMVAAEPGCSFISDPNAPVAVMVGEKNILTIAPSEMFERSEETLDYIPEPDLDLEDGAMWEIR